VLTREEALRVRINSFLRESFGLPECDYYGRLDKRGLLGLKAALSDINNALTLQVTLSFLTWIQEALSLDAKTSMAIRSAVMSCKPGSNGYDIQCNSHVPFIAEVKCNVPINRGARYGSDQRSGILRDIKALHQGKSRATGVPPQALKFMVFLDMPEIRAANDHLFRLESDAPIVFLPGSEVPRDPAVVHGVYVGLELPN
jgi:hypothetical protein